MALVTDRRKFLQASTAVGMGYWITSGVQAAVSKSPNEQIQVGCIGVGGKGDSDTLDSSKFGRIVALCDTDKKILDGMQRKLKSRMPVEHTFADYRELFDTMGDKIDAVTVSTPDHMHAVITAMAMKNGKAVYCQKPMTRTIYEARRLGEIAREKGVATQMGNQGTARPEMRKLAAQVKAGQVGNVKEVHVWTNRPVWPQGERRPMMKPVPSNLSWDLWLGVAPYRPYGEGYHDFKWRGWWDFGTGALGDMACHTCNLPFMALNMRDPYAVEAETAEHDGDSYPSWSRIKYEFPSLDGRPAFLMYWYDGGQLPPKELFDGITLKSGDNPPPHISGVMFIGDEGKLYVPGDYAEGGSQIVGGKEEMEVEFVRSPGHNKEWFDAIRDPKTPAVSNFPDYAGPLTETILLGNLAVWKRGRVEWDPKNLKPLNDPSLERIVKPTYYNGYELM